MEKKMEEMGMNEWSDEMWHIWDYGSGIYHINGVPYEYGFDDSKEMAWLQLKGKDSPVIYSDIRMDDPRYINGTDLFREEVETVRMIYNLIRAKDVAGKLKTE